MIPSTLRTILTDILAACETAFVQTDTPAVPAVAYVTHGQPVGEKEQLVVSLGGVSAVHPFPLQQIRAIKSTVVPSALINIELWRACWPTAHATNPVKAMPSPAKITAAALAAADDAASLFGYLANLAADGGLLPSLPTIRTSEDVAVGIMSPLGPAGGLVGWRWPISIKLAVKGP